MLSKHFTETLSAFPFLPFLFFRKGCVLPGAHGAAGALRVVGWRQWAKSALCDVCCCWSCRWESLSKTLASSLTAVFTERNWSGKEDTGASLWMKKEMNFIPNFQDFLSGKQRKAGGGAYSSRIMGLRIIWE